MGVARVSLVVGALLIGALSIPQPVGAAAGRPPAVEFAAFARVRGYTLLLIAVGGPRGTQLVVDLQRMLPDRSYDDHEFEVSQAVDLHVASDLRSATVRTSLGRYGRVELTLSRARGRGNSGCQHRVHTGVAHGTLRLVPGGAYFGTIVFRRLHAQVSVPVHCPDAARRAARVGVPPPYIIADSRNTASSVEWQGQNGDGVAVDLFRPGRLVRVHDSIVATKQYLQMNVTANLQRATLTGSGPFLSGAALYTAKKHLDAHDTTGTVSGSLTARFATPGPRVLTGPGFTAKLTSY
jgi:hypothetical protein